MFERCSETTYAPNLEPAICEKQTKNMNMLLIVSFLNTSLFGSLGWGGQIAIRGLQAGATNKEDQSPGAGPNRIPSQVWQLACHTCDAFLEG